MSCLNLFLSCWLSIWTLITLFILIPLEGMTVDTLGMLIPSVVVAFILLYSVFEQKSFDLGETSLRLETRLFFATWRQTLPRETISHLLQVKDGGEGRDTFPSWGLKVKSASTQKNWASDIPWLVHSGRNVRYHSLLSRLPYEQSRWLGIIIAKWAGAELELCDKYY